MLQLVYASFAADMWDGNFQALCEQSATNNARHEITGIIYWDNGTFLHAFEGPKAIVEDTFLKIIRDPRHHSLRVLSRRMLSQREFGYGAMAELKTTCEKREGLEKIGAVVSSSSIDAQTAFAELFGDIINIRQPLAGKPEGENRAILS
jgi:hypothetical protein